MRHSYFGKKLSRTKNERRRLLQGLAREMILRGRIKTTLAKAHAVQPLVEKLITKAKNISGAARIAISSVLSDKTLEQKLLDDAKTRFAKRSSGFTSIIKLGARRGDGAQEVLLTFVDPGVVVEVVSVPTKKKEISVAKKTAPEKKTKPVSGRSPGRKKSVR